MKNLVKKMKEKRGAIKEASRRDELKKKVAKGAKVILEDYSKVFERLAEYDRT
ncbi:MAG: hypothetical protein AAB725_02935 [Patescibacteria group bacterium]